jgi:hypothetical protein
VVWNLLLQADSGGPSPISDKAFTAHKLSSFSQILRTDFGEFSENHNNVPLIWNDQSTTSFCVSVFSLVALLERLKRPKGQTRRLITLIFADRPEAAVMVVIRRGAASDSTRGFGSLDFTAMAQNEDSPFRVPFDRFNHHFRKK